jgi:excisionase family DNA binding protein
MAKKNDSPPRAFWTARDIAEHLGVCERTVRRWIDSGDLITHKFGRRIRISQVDFAAFLQRHRGAE